MLVIAGLIFPFFFQSRKLRVDNISGYNQMGILSRYPDLAIVEAWYLHSQTTSGGDIIYDVVYTIGDDGYRLDVDGNDFDAFIWGSFTFGEGLNDNETLSFTYSKPWNKD